MARPLIPQKDHQGFPPIDRLRIWKGKGEQKQGRLSPFQTRHSALVGEYA